MCNQKAGMLSTSDDDETKYHTYVYKSFRNFWMGLMNCLTDIFTNSMSSTYTRERINLKVRCNSYIRGVTMWSLIIWKFTFFGQIYNSTTQVSNNLWTWYSGEPTSICTSRYRDEPAFLPLKRWHPCKQFRKMLKQECQEVKTSKNTVPVLSIHEPTDGKVHFTVYKYDENMSKKLTLIFQVGHGIWIPGNTW